MASRKENEVNCRRQTLPKPARTAFQCFSDATEEQFTRNGATKKKELIRRVAEAWKGLSPEHRAYWDEQAREDKVRFVREKNAYRGEAPKKRAKKHPLAPKRPMSAFLRYSQKIRKKVKAQNPELENTDVSRLLGEMWRNASPKEKAPFVQEELKERAIYNKDVARFRAEQAKKDAASRTSHENVLKQDPSQDQEEKKRVESFEEASVAPASSNESSEATREYPTQAREEKTSESFEEPIQAPSIDERARFYEMYRPDRAAPVARIDSPSLHDFPVPNFDPYAYVHYTPRGYPPAAMGPVTFTLSDGEYPPPGRARSNEQVPLGTGSSQQLQPPRDFDETQALFWPHYFSDGSRFYPRHL